MDLTFLIILSLAAGLAAWLFFMSTVKSGQYEDPEGAKYRMLEDDDEAPRPPGRSAGDGAPPGRSGGRVL